MRILTVYNNRPYGILSEIPEMFTEEVKITSRHLTTCEGQGLEYNIIIWSSK